MLNRPRQPVEPSHNQDVPCPRRGDRAGEFGALAIGAGRMLGKKVRATGHAQRVGLTGRRLFTR